MEFDKDGTTYYISGRAAMGCGASVEASSKVADAPQPEASRGAANLRITAPVDPRVLDAYSILDETGAGTGEVRKSHLLVGLREFEGVREALGIDSASFLGRERFEADFDRIEKEAGKTVSVHELDAFLRSTLEWLSRVAVPAPKHEDSPQSSVAVAMASDGTVDRTRTLAAMFEALDVDRSGTLHFYEFRKQLNCMVGDDKSAEFFAGMDTDGDQSLTLDEWCACMLRNGESKSDEDFEETIRIWMGLLRYDGLDVFYRRCEGLGQMNGALACRL